MNSNTSLMAALIRLWGSCLFPYISSKFGYWCHYSGSIICSFLLEKPWLESGIAHYYIKLLIKKKKKKQGWYHFFYKKKKLRIVNTKLLLILIAKVGFFFPQIKWSKIRVVNLFACSMWYYYRIISILFGY